MGGGGSKKDKVNDAGSKADDTPTLLLLGTAGVGKTTIVRQVAVSMGDGLSDKQKKENVDALRHCIVGRTARVIERAAADEKIGDGLLENFEAFEEISGSYEGVEEKTNKIGEIITKLWNDAAFAEVAKGDFAVSYEEGLNDSCAALFENKYAEIFSPSYWSQIKNEDIMNIRKPTQSIHVISGKFNNEVFNMKDVGGQIHQRSKWPGAFAGATAVMFIVSLMDLFMDGEDAENRLVNSQKIFSSICGSSELKSVPCCVIFNKEDLFKEAIQTRSIDECSQFKDIKPVKGEESTDAKFKRYLSELKKFFRQGYDSVHDGDDVNEVQFYNTCATDGEAVQRVITKLLGELNKLSVDSMMS
jgi:GTPase SAR1 family protein